jgi:hypothetical protein
LLTKMNVLLEEQNRLLKKQTKWLWKITL